MLPALTKTVLENKEKIRSKISDKINWDIIQEAKKNWVSYNPQKEKSKIAGVDSSFNKVSLQGFSFWAIQAVAVDSNSQVLKFKHACDVSSPNEINLNTKSSEFEISVSGDVADKVDYVLIDGSLTSHFAWRQHADVKLKQLIKTIKQFQNILFIAKTSSSVHQFKKMNAGLADIAYYNKLDKTPGFSKISIDERFGKDVPVTYVYARVDKSLGLFKLELYGRNYSEEMIKLILDKINYNCVKGYPYCLKQAHNKCKITDEHMRNFSRIIGLTNEFGAREILEA